MTSRSSFPKVQVIAVGAKEFVGAKEVGVDETRELDQVTDGEFKPLADQDRITIKGGEIFVSHVPKGGSS